MRTELGVVESLGLVGSLVFAVPVGIAAVETLLDGRTAVGATLLAVAVLMVVVPRHVTGPGDLPGELAARLAGLAVLDRAPDAGERDDGADDAGEAAGGGARRDGDRERR